MNTPQLRSLAGFIDTLYEEVITESSSDVPTCHWAPKEYIGEVAGVYIQSMELAILDGTGDTVVVHVDSGDDGDLFLANILLSGFDE